jgi:hypothetical protein
MPLSLITFRIIFEIVLLCGVHATRERRGLDMQWRLTNNKSNKKIVINSLKAEILDIREKTVN